MDLIFVVVNGRVVETGTHRELMSSPAYRRIVLREEAP
jgi:ABC-type multidrug transport system fused ATPase/permease subunit